jgi:dipeptidyl aminopeptidase/acylaminoacyl peptidase
LTKDHDAESIAFLTAFLGTDYTKHPEVWRQASPVFRVGKDDAAFLIVHGTQDQNVAIEQSQELYEKLQAAGVQVSFIKVNDAHTFQTSAAKQEMIIETLAFFNRNLTRAVEASCYIEEAYGTAPTDAKNLSAAPI